MKKPIISLLLIATGKYDQFVQPLLDSVDKYFFADHEVNIYLFADKFTPLTNSRLKIHGIKIEHTPWPGSTLFRYRYFSSIAESIKGTHVFYCDVDMLFVSPVGNEILNDGLTAVMHPGFYKGGWGSNGCDPKSLAWLPEDKCHGYCAGGFQGGSKEKYLNACEILSDRIDDDLSSGVMAPWHDESHWNALLKITDLNIKTLSPSYCYPESWPLPFEKKLLALDKNHKEIRS